MNINRELIILGKIIPFPSGNLSNIDKEVFDEEGCSAHHHPFRRYFASFIFLFADQNGINACYKKVNGQMRIFTDRSDECRLSELIISLYGSPISASTPKLVCATELIYYVPDGVNALDCNSEPVVEMNHQRSELTIASSGRWITATTYRASPYWAQSWGIEVMPCR